MQYFDYVNNNAYEFGGQSFGGALYSRFRTTSKFQFQTRFDLSAMLLGGVNSDYAYLVVTPEQERQREYDYGYGSGLSLEVGANYASRVYLRMFYRGQLIHVTNGSTYNAESNINHAADHVVEAAGVGLRFPIRNVMSIDLDGGVFLRESHFDDPLLVDRTLRVPQARLMLSWSPSRGVNPSGGAN